MTNIRITLATADIPQRVSESLESGGWLFTSQWDNSDVIFVGGPSVQSFAGSEAGHILWPGESVRLVGVLRDLWFVSRTADVAILINDAPI